MSSSMTAMKTRQHSSSQMVFLPGLNPSLSVDVHTRYGFYVAKTSHKDLVIRCCGISRCIEMKREKFCFMYKGLFLLIYNKLIRAVIPSLVVLLLWLRYFLLRLRCLLLLQLIHSHFLCILSSTLPNTAIHSSKVDFTKMSFRHLVSLKLFIAHADERFDCLVSLAQFGISTQQRIPSDLVGRLLALAHIGEHLFCEFHLAVFGKSVQENRP
ncbi:hypothetical protein KCU93_g30, partial [Aureobasidium melanogenum]